MMVSPKCWPDIWMVGPRPVGEPLGPHLTHAVTKEEYLWAMFQHTMECSACWLECLTEPGCANCVVENSNTHMCSTGRMFCSEIRRQGWDVKDTPTEKPEHKSG